MTWTGPSILEVARAAGITSEKSSGDEHFFKCPFHDDHTPSLRLNARKNTFICDPCVALGQPTKGGVKALATLMHVDLAVLAGRGPNSSPEQSKPLDAAAIWNSLENYDPEGEEALYSRHLHEARGRFIRFATELCAFPEVRWFAKQGFRLAAPLFDGAGDVKAIALRLVRPGADKKFRFIGSVSDLTYGDPTALQHATRVVVTEGLVDTVVAQLSALPEVAVLGVPSAATPRATIKALSRAANAGFKGEVFAFPHNDDAGRKMMETIARNAGVRVRMVEPMVLKKGGDLGDIWEAVRGDTSRFRAILSKASSLAKPWRSDQVEDPAEILRIPKVKPKRIAIPRRTLLVRRSLLERVHEGAVLAKKLRAGRRRLGDEKRKPRVLADQWLALKIETLLRKQAEKSGRAFSHPAFLTKVLKKSKQEIATALKWLASQEFARSDDGTWPVVLATSMDEIGSAFIPVPEAALRLRPSDFFLLATLHQIAEDRATGSIRTRIIPAIAKIPRKHIAETLAKEIGRHRVGAALNRLEVAGFVDRKGDARHLKLTPQIAQKLRDDERGHNSPFAAMKVT